MWNCNAVKFFLQTEFPIFLSGSAKGNKYSRKRKLHEWVKQEKIFFFRFRIHFRCVFNGNSATKSVTKVWRNFFCSMHARKKSALVFHASFHICVEFPLFFVDANNSVWKSLQKVSFYKSWVKEIVIKLEKFVKMTSTKIHDFFCVEIQMWQFFVIFKHYAYFSVIDYFIFFGKCYQLQLCNTVMKSAGQWFVGRCSSEQLFNSHATLTFLVFFEIVGNAFMIGFHSLFAWFPIGRTDFAMFVGELEALN